MRPIVLEKSRTFLFDRMQAKYLHLLAGAKETSTTHEQSRPLGRRPV
jgi:hypothetical protein